MEGLRNGESIYGGGGVSVRKGTAAEEYGKLRRTSEVARVGGSYFVATVRNF